MPWGSEQQRARAGSGDASLAESSSDPSPLEGRERSITASSTGTQPTTRAIDSATAAARTPVAIMLTRRLMRRESVLMLVLLPRRCEHPGHEGRGAGGRR